VDTDGRVRIRGRVEPIYSSSTAGEVRGRVDTDGRVRIRGRIEPIYSSSTGGEVRGHADTDDGVQNKPKERCQAHGTTPDSDPPSGNEERERERGMEIEGGRGIERDRVGERERER
jgi:hypothetical protein